MPTVINASTFSSPPTMSGANITTNTIPVASFVSLVTTTYADLPTNQSFTGINTFTQQPVMKFTTSFASQNLFYGYLAGNSITTGTKDTIFGYNCGPLLTTSAGNLLIGVNAGALMTTGATANNTFIGVNAGAAELTTISHVSIGFEAGKNSVSGNFNTFVGHQAPSGDTGNQSVFIGKSSGSAGNLCTALGANANPGALGKTTAIGFGATCTVSNQVMLGTSAEHVYCPGTGTNGSLRLLASTFQNMGLATVAGSSSGDLTWAQIEQGGAYKRVVIYCGNSAALVGTATITFTTPFLHTPAVIINSRTGGLAANIVTFLTNTSATITGASSTGFIFLGGY